jgi:hypothetical protein
MIAGANCDGNEVRQLSDETSDFRRLFNQGFRIEHVEQVSGNTNEVEVEASLISQRNQ